MSERILAIWPLTMGLTEDYITLLSAPPPGAMARFAKPLTVYAVNHPAMSYGHDGCAGFGGSGAHRRRDRTVPGCLTSESEERETWTAESLRAASSNGEGFGFLRARTAMEETSAVDVSGQHYDRDGEQSPERTEWDLVKVAARMRCH